MAMTETPVSHEEYKAVVMTAFLQTSPDECEEKRYTTLGERVIAIPTGYGPGALAKWWIYPEDPNAHWAEDADKYGVSAWKGEVWILDSDGTPMIDIEP